MGTSKVLHPFHTGWLIHFCQVQTSTKEAIQSRGHDDCFGWGILLQVVEILGNILHAKRWTGEKNCENTIHQELSRRIRRPAVKANYQHTKAIQIKHTSFYLCILTIPGTGHLQGHSVRSGLQSQYQNPIECWRQKAKPLMMIPISYSAERGIWKWDLHFYLWKPETSVTLFLTEIDALK